MRGFLLSLGLAAWWGFGSVSVQAQVASDWGPFYVRMVDLEGNQRSRALGPFFEWSELVRPGRFWAFRPWISRLDDSERDGRRWDILWPLGESKTSFNSLYWRAGIWLGWDHDVANEDSRYRTWLLPFWFQGRTRDGSTYRALWPIWGEHKDFIGRDSIRVGFFPLYLSTRINDLRSTSVLWPIYSRTVGPEVERWRVFPLYGYSRRSDQFTRRFVLWPFWNQADYPRRGGSGFMLFPIYGQIKLPDQQVRWYLPPLFKVARGGKTETTHAPWPFIQISSGELEKFWIWPLFGTKKVGDNRRSFVLFPVFWHDRIAHADEVVDRRFALPFWMSEKRTRNEDAAITARYHKLWPLVSRRRQGDAVRWRVLDLWPLQQTGAIERNWAPLWTLFSHYRSGERSETEVLWGLYRRVKGEDHRHTSLFPLFETRREGEDGSWSILKGLVGRERKEDEKSWRFLYVFRFGGD